MSEKELLLKQRHMLLENIVNMHPLFRDYDKIVRWTKEQLEKIDKMLTPKLSKKARKK